MCKQKWILKFGETFSKQLTEKKVSTLDLQSILVLLKRMIPVLYRTLHFNSDNDTIELIFEDVDNNYDNYSYTHTKGLIVMDIKFQRLKTLI